jgi:hypothetical protein
VYVRRRLPRVVTVWVAFPLDQVLKLTLTPSVSVIDDGFHLVFLLTLDEIRWRAREVGTVGLHFDVGG